MSETHLRAQTGGRSLRTRLEVGLNCPAYCLDELVKDIFNGGKEGLAVRGGWGFKGGGKIRMLNRWRLCEKARSAALRGLKAQQVRSPGQRPGYHVPIPYAL